MVRFLFCYLFSCRDNKLFFLASDQTVPSLHPEHPVLPSSTPTFPANHGLMLPEIHRTVYYTRNKTSDVSPKTPPVTIQTLTRNGLQLKADLKPSSHRRPDPLRFVLWSSCPSSVHVIDLLPSRDSCPVRVSINPHRSYPILTNLHTTCFIP